MATTTTPSPNDAAAQPAAPSAAAPAATSDDRYAQDEAVRYIQGLLDQRKAVESQIKQVTTDLAEAKDASARLDRQVQAAHESQSRTATNLQQARVARTKLKAVWAFFQARQEETDRVAGDAREMAANTFRAMRYLGAEGLARVHEILVTIEPTAVDSDKSVPRWTSMFVDKVRDAETRGNSALADVQAAVQKSFEAAIASRTVNLRARHYAQLFKAQWSDLGFVVHRLIQEHALAKRNLDRLKRLQKVITDQVNAKQKLIDEVQFRYELLDAEYSAAEQGASYSPPGA
jgi:hypothetical protein